MAGTIEPSISKVVQQGRWLIVHAWLPTPDGKDIAYCPVFARFDGNKLVDWTTVAPPDFDVSANPEPYPKVA